MDPISNITTTSNVTNSTHNSTIIEKPADNLNSTNNSSIVAGKKRRELDAYSELKIEKTMSNLVSGGEIQGRILIGVYDQDD